jgi:glucokinase
MDDMVVRLVGVDIGGTKTEAIVVDGFVDGRFTLLGQARRPTAAYHPDALVESVVATIRAALDEADTDATAVSAMGLGVPGQVIPATGEVRLAANLNLAGYPLGPALTAVFNVPVTVENDVRAATVGVYHRLQEQAAVQNLAYVSIGTGMAAGLVVDGRLYRGSHGLAGEIGHVIVEPEGVVCNCGARGCLETIVAGPAIVRQALAAGFSLREAPLHAGHVYEAAAQGDPLARQVVGRVSRALALALQSLVMTCDVEKVVLGGGVTAVGSAFFNPLLDALASLRAQSPLLTELLAEEKFLLLLPGYNPGAWGGVMLAKERLETGDWRLEVGDERLVGRSV